MTESAPTPVPMVDSAAAQGPRRAEVLAWLKDSEQSRTAQDVASALDLHINTARFHLEALVREGLAERVSEPRNTPGRPRILYSADPEGPGPRSYRLLAEMLTGLVSSLGPDDGVLAQAGAAWGRHLVEGVAPSRRIDAATALARLESLLAGLGFQPTSEAADGGAELRMHNCPFVEVAEAHTDIICRLHRAIMSGALEELRAPLTVTALRPFVGPRLCVATLEAAAERPEPG